MKNPFCLWQCGRSTANHTRICDLCWADRESIYLARKAREAAEGKNQKRVAAGKRARMAAVGLDLPVAQLS